MKKRLFGLALVLVLVASVLSGMIVTVGATEPESAPAKIELLDSEEMIEIVDNVVTITFGEGKYYAEYGEISQNPAQSIAAFNSNIPGQDIVDMKDTSFTGDAAAYEMAKQNCRVLDPGQGNIKYYGQGETITFDLNTLDEGERWLFFIYRLDDENKLYKDYRDQYAVTGVYAGYYPVSDDEGGSTPDSKPTHVEFLDLVEVEDDKITITFDDGDYFMFAEPIPAEGQNGLAEFVAHFNTAVGQEIFTLTGMDLTNSENREYVGDVLYMEQYRVYPTSIELTERDDYYSNETVTLDLTTLAEGARYLIYITRVDESNTAFDGVQDWYAITGVYATAYPACDEPYDVTLDDDGLVNAGAAVFFYPEGVFSGNAQHVLPHYSTGSKTYTLENNSFGAVVVVYAEEGYVFEEIPVVTVNGVSVRGEYDVYEGAYIYCIEGFEADSTIAVVGEAVASAIPLDGKIQDVSGWMTREGNTVTITAPSGASYFVEVWYAKDHGDVPGYGAYGDYAIVKPVNRMVGNDIVTNIEELGDSSYAYLISGAPLTGSTTITVSERCIIVIIQVDPGVKLENYHGDEDRYAIAGTYAVETGVEFQNIDLSVDLSLLPTINENDVVSEIGDKIFVEEGVIVSADSNIYPGGVLVIKVTPDNVEDLIHPEIIAWLLEELGVSSLKGQALIDAIDDYFGEPVEWADPEVINPAYVVAEGDVYGLLVYAGPEYAQKATLHPDVAVTFNGTTINTNDIIFMENFDGDAYESMRFYVSLGPVKPHVHEYEYTPNNDGTHNGACDCGEDAVVNEACAYVGGECEKCGYVEPVMPPTVDVPVSNGENKVDVKVEVSGNDVTVKPLDQAQIEQLVDNDNDASDIVIDLTGLDMSIDTAGIPKSTLEAIVAVAEDDSNNVEHLVIKLSTAELKLDETAMRAIVDQANGDIIKFNFDDVGLDRLNTAQKEAVKDMDVRKGYEAYITVNDQRIGDFRGGNVEIVVPYAVPDGENPAFFSVWYIDEDGNPEKQVSTYDGKVKCFVVSHFSDYVIVYTPEDVADADSDGGFRVITLVIWIIVILLILLACVIAYFIFKKKKEKQDDEDKESERQD